MARSRPVKRPECGATRGIWLHQKNEEILCRECKDLKNAEARERRKTNPPDRDLENSKVSAMRRLAGLHPTEYHNLLLEELAKRITPSA